MAQPKTKVSMLRVIKRKLFTNEIHMRCELYVNTIIGTIYRSTNTTAEKNLSYE